MVCYLINKKSLIMPYIQVYSHQNIYYEQIQGDTRKPILVFLHEALGCIEMWKNVPNYLCEKTGYRGLVYDRIGFGKSSDLNKNRTINYLHDSALNELPLVLSLAIPNQEYILVGHSDGGSIALIHASEQPELLKAIITEAAHVFVENETIKGIKLAKSAWLQGKLDGLNRYHGEKTESLFLAWANTWLNNGFKYWNIEYLLPSINCPIFAIQGSDDQYGTEKQLNLITSLIPKNATSEMVQNCGHTPHKDEKEKIIHIMSNFIILVTSNSEA